MSFLISNAYAAPAAGAEGGGMSMIFMLVVFAAIFYFMIFRPQNKRAKEQKNLMASLSKGDEVLTHGGLVGRIVKVAEDNDYIAIELNENNQIVLKKDYISAVLPKGTLKSL
ncbi:preprotein translocase subunit YajC [Motilimonas pumila]|uniref:Sec translocon accessory complex subunit YajC n=1 Tax=Motilimonas pumila TaxID=2303987 RepID=A0A418YEL7_9GAMM|nr:preprotein translocase subunit YajC [Motilimonas pumila]RJG47597.1 preprotein translocase subunit YajC [Motilimonas pumila]